MESFTTRIIPVYCIYLKDPSLVLDCSQFVHKTKTQTKIALYDVLGRENFDSTFTYSVSKS